MKTKAIGAFAIAVVVLMTLKDGSLPKLVDDAASGAKDLAAGIRPVTTIT